MQKLRFLLPLLFVTLLAFGQDFPKQQNPPRLVNDFGEILTDQEEARLEEKLLRYSDTTSTQITIVVLKEKLLDDPNLYAAELAQKWGVGQEGADNGVIFLLAPKAPAGQRKMAIQNGYGLEPVVTDALTKRIIEEYVIPQFKQENYYQGIDEGTDQIIKLLAGEFKGKGQRRSKGEKGIPFFAIILIAIIIISVIRNRRGGGGRGGYRGGGGYWIGGLGGGGFGGSSGGGFGGGGFGGFGGGGFGGGGASGSW